MARRPRCKTIAPATRPNESSATSPRQQPAWKRRPPRLGLIYESQPVWFVTFCTFHRRKWLASDTVHGAFIHFARRAGTDFNIAVGKYVIMPDHIHLFVCGPHEFDLKTWIGALKQALARAVDRRRTSGAIWQQGFFDHLLRNDESISEKWNYVELNPVRAGLSKTANDWPYRGEIVRIDRA